LGPIVQSGYISGVYRLGTDFSHHRIMLDARTDDGMSGAPVCTTDTGTVIGIHYGGIAWLSAHAMPLSVPRMRVQLDAWDRTVGPVKAKLGLK